MRNFRGGNNWAVVVIFVFLMAGFLVQPLSAQDLPLPAVESKVHSDGGYQQLKNKAEIQGKVRVIVTMHVSVPAVAAQDMDKEAGFAYRQQIAAVQGRVVDALKGRQASGISHFKYTPQTVMFVDADALDALLRNPEVSSVHEDVMVRPTLNLSVPRIGAPSVWWSKGFTGAGMAVAVLDTGVDQWHPFLSGSVVSEACYSTNQEYIDASVTSLCPGGVTESTGYGTAMPYGWNCPAGECDHGTHVAGIVAGRWNGTQAGVAPGASIIAVQVFSRIEEYGYLPYTSAFWSDIMKGMQRVFDLRGTYNIAAVNLSLGGGLYSSYCDSNPLKPYVDMLRSVGIASVIASGNDYQKSYISAPACISTAVSVGATDDSDFVASYSNSNSILTLLAPGSSIYSSVPGNYFESWNGTSMATPHVAGAWALMKQVRPGITVDEARSLLVTTGTNIMDTNAISKPRINVDRAVNLMTCTYSLSPNPISVVQGGGTGTVTITTQAGCPWTVSESLSWLSITTATSGTGPGSFNYSVSANTVAGRNGTVTVSGLSLPVLQAGFPGLPKIGAFRSGNWYLDQTGEGGWSGCGTTGTTDRCFTFGMYGDFPLAANWNGVGTNKMGVFRAGTWYLDYDGSGTWNPPTDRTYVYGMAGDWPVAGDWSGGGFAKVGVFRAGTFYLDYTGEGAWSGCGTTGTTDRCYTFGMAGDFPVAGNWNGVGGTSKIGVFRNGSWYLDYNGNGVWEGCATDRCYTFGMAGDIPIIGNWNGAGGDKIGVFRNGAYYLDANGNGIWEGCSTDICILSYGTAGDFVVTGLW